MIEVETQPCLGCDETAWFTMSEEQFRFWQQGVHVQDIFPTWSPEDRERLISGTCPDCWEEMWAEEEDEEDYDWDDYTAEEVADMFPEADLPEYQSDYYVDCD